MAKSYFNFKRISDPVHGTIGLSEPEVKVINTQAFQRLRKIRQLGLAYLVYPSADYSRFSHSLGTCHVMGQMLDALKRNSHPFGPEEVQLYRLAALLHDIGHYPFSHAMEKAVAESYGSGVIRRMNENTSLPSHEILGERVLNLDAELSDILSETGFDPSEIASLFLRETPKRMRYANLISSDLDADRIDYMLRTACHTGLPYGSLDINYLLSQMEIDQEGRLVFPEKAIGAVDHFLISRYFNYKQVSYHKSVCAFERILGDVLRAMLKKNFMGCRDDASLPWIKLGIKKDDKKGDWHMMTDPVIESLVTQLNKNTRSDVLRLKTATLLNRYPPKEVWRYELIGHRKDDKEIFSDKKKLIGKCIDDCSRKFGIRSELWIQHKISAWPLTKAEPFVSADIPDADYEDFKEENARAVHIEAKSNRDHPVLIFNCRNSLMRVMASYAYFSLRVYVIQPTPDPRQLKKITEQLGKDMKSS